MFRKGKRKSPAEAGNSNLGSSSSSNQLQHRPSTEGDELRQLNVGATESGDYHSGKTTNSGQQPARPKQHEEDLTGDTCGLLSESNSEKQQFLAGNEKAACEKVDRRRIAGSNGKKAHLAKQETIDGDDNNNNDNDREDNQKFGIKGSDKKKAKEAKWKGEEEKVSCSTMVMNLLKSKRALIPLVIISCLAAIYCIPYVEINPETTIRLPHIPFNFRDGPLRPSSVSQFKIEQLFRDQISGPESVALDSSGNMYMAIDGGFILYAHLNKSSPIKRHYYTSLDQLSSGGAVGSGRSQLDVRASDLPDLVRVAELNGIASQTPGRRREREAQARRRECLLDEKVYGPNLYTNGRISHPNEIDTTASATTKRNKGFVSNVVVSRCSKPLGIRLSPDENYLYVVDTRNGLYRVSLSASAMSGSQRTVVKLVDFQQGKIQELPVTHLDLPSGSGEFGVVAINGRPAFANVSMTAVDDLAIDYGAGTRGGDIIYLSLSSQNWPALSYLYDLLEGRPSGAILRFDSGTNKTSVLDSHRVAHVRTSSLELNNADMRAYKTYNDTLDEPYLGIGSPRLDENDVFDDRPLHFPNGLELTKDRQAILIADTSNKRIIKHYIRGARKGTSDLWAWTPHFPDNIRRGYDQEHETYWVVGCGRDPTGKFELLDWLQPWPRLRKFLLKNFYLIGWFFEQMGAYVLRSTSVRDFGYSVKIGHSLCENMCPGMMILQYNSQGDLIRSIYSNEFPNDLVYYSQVNEVVDAKTQEHLLYLSSPSYKYVTKLTLPTESFDLPTTTNEV